MRYVTGGATTPGERLAAMVEGLRSATGLGEILHLTQAGARILSDGRGHYNE